MATEGGYFHASSVSAALVVTLPRRSDAHAFAGYSGRVAQTLGPEYDGWKAERVAMRDFSTEALAREVLDGPPARRMAALSLVHVTELSQELLEDWVRTLPVPEANELLGAITARQENSGCRDALRWAAAGRLGYERRRLPTFLVMLFGSLEALDASDCAEAAGAWEETADWLGRVYGKFDPRTDQQDIDDLSLFVFENYLDRAPMFEAFCGMVSRHAELAISLSNDPATILSPLPEAQQRLALMEAESAGGLPFRESWRRLKGHR
jgi:hypothetical protein